MRGATCWTDHKMVRAKLRVRLPRTSGSRDKKSFSFAVHAGRKPTKPQAVMKDNGEELTQGPSEVLTRWHQSFSRLLNVESVFSEEVLESITALPHFAELDTTPSEEELVRVLSKLKSGKAGGKTGILPELVSCGGVHLFKRLLVLMQDVSREGKVVDDWKDAVVALIPKKETSNSVITGGVLVYWRLWGRFLPESYKNNHRPSQNIPYQSLSVASEKEEDVWT